ncbi:MAG: sulfotransferase domain-containing protein [Halofilum sp. (in: g-proteobacteria)]|nr:sulfotransferase domain-containing protein [Halofilum sp. (in: g-proteobacteria)]
MFVFDIERDVRDVVVSSYYDMRNRHGYTGSFARYYWREGRFTADWVSRYHALWRNAGPRFCMVSYEGLHEDFASEIERIAEVLGLSPDPKRIEQLRQQTSIGSLRKRYEDQPLYQGDRFFRKGVVGDWRNHFDAAMTRDIEHIEAHGIGPLDWRRLLRRASVVLPNRSR